MKNQLSVGKMYLIMNIVVATDHTCKSGTARYHELWEQTPVVVLDENRLIDFRGAVLGSAVTLLTSYGVVVSARFPVSSPFSYFFEKVVT